MLSLFILGSLIFTDYGVKLPSTTIDEYYSTTKPLVIGYDIIDLKLFEIVKTEKIDFNKVPIKDIGSYNSESECIDKILEAIGDVNYNEAQSDPNKIDSMGGNCQAYTLLLETYLRKYQLESDIAFSNIHMYNVVRVDGVWYDLDLINSIMEKQEGLNE